MQNIKTKHALLTSIISIVLCVTMLVGSTYAWFTDQASTSTNNIVAGTLNITLEQFDETNQKWVSAEGQTLKFVDMDENDLWEPGCTYRLPSLRIANDSNLAVKYEIVINGIDSETGLNKAIEWTVVGDLAGSLMPSDKTSNEIQISAHMKEESGNEFQGMTMDGVTVTVYATQKAEEYDSNDNSYDANAEYAVADDVYVQADGSLKAVSVEGLSEVAKLASADETITSVSYNGAQVPVVRDNAAMEDALTSGATIVVLTEDNYTIPDSARGKTLTIVGNGDTNISVVDDGASEGDIDYSLRGSNVVFENVTLNIKGSDHPGYAGLSATYNNCTIVGSNYTLYGDSVFNNCTFNLNNGYVWTWGAKNVEFNSCTFEDIVGGAAKAILVHNTVETVVTVKDCTFKGTVPKTTWDGIPVAAVSIDPENGSPDATVYFAGTNSVSDAYNSLYQVKYADEVDDVKVYIDGIEQTITAMK